MLLIIIGNFKPLVTVKALACYSIDTLFTVEGIVN
jgi:hypothetical protein